jgi:hypothetical protein
MTTPNTGSTASAAQKVRTPATALIVLGILYGLGSLWNIIAYMLDIKMGDEEAMAQMPGFVAFMQKFGMVLGLLGIVIAALIVLGGLNMRRLKSRGFAMTGAVLAMLPISCCCVIGLPIGIWALIVMLKPDVTAAFGHKIGV